MRDVLWFGVQGEQDDASPAARWRVLDAAWREAFRLAWEAATSGNIGVGAVVAEPTGLIVAASRNRVMDRDAPDGEVAGSSLLAHAEINALARLPFRSPRQLVLTTTLQPCLQCSAAIRMGPVAIVRVGGADPLWNGCEDFSPLNPRLTRRPAIEGPRQDEIGVFATLLSRLGPGLPHHVAEALIEHGETPVIDLARQIQADGTFDELRTRTVEQAFNHLWAQLREASDARWGSPVPGST